MKNDSSRLPTFDVRKHFSRVLQQQGRVQLDADWNEQGEIIAHRVETEGRDVIGECGAPLDNPGFRITVPVPSQTSSTSDTPSVERSFIVTWPAGGSPFNFRIGAGRYYVDGILCENNAETSFLNQPDLPQPETPAHANLYVAYLDVWQRLITALDDPSIRETALGGPDTTTRSKTVWQVKAWPVPAADQPGLDCSTELASFDKFIEAPTGKLGAREAIEQTSTDPCKVPPGAGYRGLENQLYRVEVHHGGSALDVATASVVPVSRVAKNPYQVRYGIIPFEVTDEVAEPVGNITEVARFTRRSTWTGEAVEIVTMTRGGDPLPGTLAIITASDISTQTLTLNVNVADIQGDSIGIRTVGATYKASRDNGVVVTSIEGIDGTKVKVHDLGPDTVLGFETGQWVEYSDDVLELNGKPGVMAQILATDPVAMTVTLNTPPPPLVVPAGQPPDLSHHPKLRRWDFFGVIKFAAGGGWIDLENGLQISFEKGTFRTGDYWTIPARTAVAGALAGFIEWPKKADGDPLFQLPFGIQHRYCRLALLGRTANGALHVVEDCRRLFPSLTTPTLVYVGGDGQETMPGNDIPQLLEAGVFNGPCAVRHAEVEFMTEHGGRVAADKAGLQSATAPHVLVVRTGADGIARCAWRPNPAGNGSQRVAARLPHATHGGPTLHFNGNLSVAGDVSYVAKNCEYLAGAKTVQEALDKLCQREEDCECTVCVSPDENGFASSERIQKAIAEAKAKGGGKVCLKPGTYLLDRPIEIEAMGLTLTGHDAAWLVFMYDGPAIRVLNSADVTIEHLVIFGLGANTDSTVVGVEIHDCAFDIEVSDCVIRMFDLRSEAGGRDRGVGIQVYSVLQHVHLLRNLIDAATGIGTFNRKLCGLDLEVRQNLLICSGRGIDLDCLALTADIDQNWIVLDTRPNALGIALNGPTAADGAISIDGNNIVSAGGGIAFTTSSTTVSNNTLTGSVTAAASRMDVFSGAADPAVASAIMFGAGQTPLKPHSVKILANRIKSFRGHGVCFTGPVASAIVKQNSISNLGGGGIAASSKGVVDRLWIENNDIEHVGLAADREKLPACGIRVLTGEEVDISHNRIADVSEGMTNAVSHGIYLYSPRHVRVIGNSISDIKGAPGIAGITFISAAIEIAGVYGTAEIAENDIQWQPEEKDGHHWNAILIGDSRSANTVGGWSFMLDSPQPNERAKMFSAGTVIFTNGTAFKLFAAEQALIVRANVMQMRDLWFNYLVSITTRGTCTFGANDCRAIGSPDKVSLATLSAETLIVDSNHLLGGAGIEASAQRWTMLGNIYEGSIRINNGALPLDWSKYNIPL